MENNITNTEQWLDDHRKGKVTDEQLKQYMEASGIADYSNLQDEHKAAINVIQRYNVLQQVKDVHNNYLTQQKDKSGSNSKVISIRTFRPLMKIAAVLIFCIAAAGTFFITTTSQSNIYNQLSHEYHVQTNRAESTQQVSKMVQSFNAKDFTAVINEFETLTKPAARELFLGGYAYLQTGKYDAAVSTLKKIITLNKETDERLYNDEAEYYLMLAFIKSKNYKEAHHLAKHIYNDNYHTYHKKITRLLLLKLSWLS